MGKKIDAEEKQYRKVEKWGKEKKGDKLGAYLKEVGEDKSGGVLDVLDDKKTRKDDFL
jgi:hypothetical protein